MPFAGLRFTHHDDHDMFAFSNVVIPSREEPRLAKANTSAHRVGICQGLPQACSVFRQKIWMTFRDMALPLYGQLHVASQV
jgi:hypothetical protein